MRSIGSFINLFLATGHADQGFSDVSGGKEKNSGMKWVNTMKRIVHKKSF